MQRLWLSHAATLDNTRTQTQTDRQTDRQILTGYNIINAQPAELKTSEQINKKKQKGEQKNKNQSMGCEAQLAGQLYRPGDLWKKLGQVDIRPNLLFCFAVCALFLLLRVCLNTTLTKTILTEVTEWQAHRSWSLCMVKQSSVNSRHIRFTRARRTRVVSSWGLAPFNSAFQLYESRIECAVGVHCTEFVI